jgi:hypothetical protein
MLATYVDRSTNGTFQQHKRLAKIAATDEFLTLENG